MKKLYFNSIIIMLCFVSNAQSSYYYYYEGSKIYLTLNTQYAFLSIKEPSLPDNIKQYSTKHTELKSDNLNEKKSSRFWTELSFEKKMSNQQYQELLLDIKRQNKEAIISPYFKTNDGNKIGLSNIFYVKLKSEKDKILLEQMAEKTNSIIIKQDAIMPLWFVLSISEYSELNSMECSNIFYESGLFLAAEPNFMVDIAHCVNDEFFVEQWGLKNTGQGQFPGINGIDINTCESWVISTGENITVAVLDEGIKLDHPDLAENIHPLSFDCESGTSPQTIYGNHGTNIAGIIGAAGNNAEGIVGVAPDCRLMSVSHSLNFWVNSQQTIATGINFAWQNGADVINNSWGRDALPALYITDAINNATTLGRNGKGCVIVASTGNDNASTVCFPANLPNVIAVGAISQCGERSSLVSCDYVSWGSNYGLELDVVAPGADIFTTENSSWGYDPLFYGTSAAAAHVSGVAALILSANPNLTAQQVQDIIESTAQKTRTDLYSYSTTSGRPNGTWHEEMGYGFVDAYAAVQAACAAYGASLNLTITGSNTVSEEEIFSIASLPAGATVQWQFNEDFLQMCSSTGAGNICLMPNPSYFMDCPGSSTIGATVNYNGCSFSVPNKSVYVGTPPKAEHISSIKNSGRVPYKPCTFTDKVTYHGIDMFPPFYGLIEAEWVSLPTPEVTLVNPTTGGLLGGNHFTQELQVVKLGFSMLNPAHIQVRLRNYCGWSDFVTIEYKKDAGICRPIMFSYSPNPTTDELTITFEQLPTMEDSDELSVVQNISVQSITTNNQMETYSVKLFDASGTVLRQIQFTHGYQDGVPQPVIFNLSSLRKGTYFLHVEGGGELVREQIIVAK